MIGAPADPYGAPPAPARPAVRCLVLVGCAAAALLTARFALGVPGVPREAALMAAIFVLAALLWVTEALPLFATALLVIALQIVLLANPGGWPGLGFETGLSPDYRMILHNAADPVLVLFLGGFLIAQAAVKEGVDRSMSHLLLRPFGASPPAVLAGVMVVTACFSMFMSNTATAAMMVALVAPMLAQMPPREPFRRALVLAVAFSANIGGMGTPIGSPPNAVAVGHMRAAGEAPGFLEWMLVAVPLAAACLVAAWCVLWWYFRPRTDGLRVSVEPARVGRRGAFVVAVFAVTVLLWLSDVWHGLPPAVIALFPAVAYTATGTLTPNDLNRIDWSVLILIAGGIALGSGIALTGLDALIVGALPLDDGAHIVWLTVVLVAATILLSTFMSNTAASNLLLPIGISAAVALGAAGETRHIGMSIALAAALAMALPISTPPNAIAYSKNEFSVRDMARTGVLVGLAGAIMVLLLLPVLLRVPARLF